MVSKYSGDKIGRFGPRKVARKKAVWSPERKATFAALRADPVAWAAWCDQFREGNKRNCDALPASETAWRAALCGQRYEDAEVAPAGRLSTRLDASAGMGASSMAGW